MTYMLHIQCFLQIKFDPVIATPPFSEGEYYTTVERNVSLEVNTYLMSPNCFQE